MIPGVIAVSGGAGAGAPNPAPSASRWRIFMRPIDNGIGNVFEIYELKFKTGSSSTQDAVDGTTGTATASSTEPSPSAVYFPANAFDESDIADGWKSDSAEPTIDQWLEFEFLSPTAISCFEIVAAGDAEKPLDFDFQYFDGVDWITVSSYNLVPSNYEGDVFSDCPFDDPDAGGGVVPTNGFTFDYPRDSLDTTANKNKANIIFSTVNQTITSITGNFSASQSGEINVFKCDNKNAIVEELLGTKTFTTGAGGEQTITFDTPIAVQSGWIIAIVARDTASTGLSLFVTSAQTVDDNGFWTMVGSEGTATDPISVAFDFTPVTTFNYALDINSEVASDYGFENHQYWRMRFLEVQNAAFATVAELEMRTAPAGADTTTTGQAISGGADNLPVVNAFDNNAGTWWRNALTSGELDGNEWIGQDYGLGSELELKEITVQTRTSPNQNQAPRQGIIEYSDDNVTWSGAWAFLTGNWITASSTRTFTSPILSTTPPPSGGGGGADPDTYQYWRVRFTSAANSDFFGVAEVQLKTTSGGPDLATGGTALAFAADEGTSATNAFDDNTATDFTYDYGTRSKINSYIGYDLGVGNEAAINRILITAPSGVNGDRAPTAFVVEGSADNFVWRGVGWTVSGISWASGETKTFVKP